MEFDDEVSIEVAVPLELGMVVLGMLGSDKSKLLALEAMVVEFDGVVELAGAVELGDVVE